MSITPFVLRRALWGLAAIASLAGLALQFAPVRLDIEPLAPSMPDTAASVTGPGIDGTAAEEIVLANVFSRSRRAPASRYVPAEFTTDSAGGGVTAEGMSVADPVAAVDDGLPRLYGTVVGADGARALLQLSTASGARLYAAGEHDAGYTVVSVAPREVVLRGPGGRRTLRLAPEDRQ